MRSLVAALLALGALCAMGEIRVDTRLPAGCAIVKQITNDTVTLTIDNRDSSAQWIYWAFRVTGAEGRTLSFKFTNSCAVGSRGAAVSLDRGKSWTWSDLAQPKSVAKDELGDHKSWNDFSWSFARDAHEVWFSQMIPYGLREWNGFLAQHQSDLGRVFETNTLCLSRKGRAVPCARFGRLDGKAPYRLFVSSRHHCEESSATYVVEGMLTSFFGEGDLAQWLRENVELRVVPFADFDGVVDGDQGKNRKPWDHARDYNENREPRYPEVAAIKKMLDAWQPTGVQDTHCPWLRGKWTEKFNTNEYCYQVGSGIKEDVMHDFGAIVEKVCAERTNGPRIAYRVADDLPFGVGWNSRANYTQGMTLKDWALRHFPNLRLSTSWEIPFANQREATLYPADDSAFGNDLMAAWRIFLSK